VVVRNNGPAAPRLRARHLQLPGKHRQLVRHPRSNSRQLRWRIVAAAESQLGWPYLWGGESEAEGGFDCSGLVDYAFAMAGHALPGRPTAEVLWAMSQPIKASQLEAGDLVFLLNSNGYAYHVGLYAGFGQVVVAPHTGTRVQMQELGDTPWQAYGRLWQPDARPLPYRYVGLRALPSLLAKGRAPAPELTLADDGPPPAVALTRPLPGVTATEPVMAAGRAVRHHRRPTGHGGPGVYPTPARDQELGIGPLEPVFGV
jgi:hypothetical protein